MKNTVLLITILTALLLSFAAGASAAKRGHKDAGPSADIEAPTPAPTPRAAMLINDGGFEMGPPPTSAWTVGDASSCPTIEWSGVEGVTPKTGLFMFYGGGYCKGVAAPNSVSQSVTIPNGTKSLTFWIYSIREGADDSDNDDVLRVLFGNSLLYSYPLNTASNTDAWKKMTLDVSMFAGKTDTLIFETLNRGNEKNFGHVFVDDISLETADISSSAYNGWWYTSGQGGSGLSVAVEGDVLFLAWYIYRDDGTPVWYVSWAEETDSGVYSGELRSYSGWTLGEAWQIPDYVVAGTITLSFTDATNGSITWDMGCNNAGTKSITKYMDEIAPGAEDSRNLTGWWIDNSYSGMGWFLEAQGNTLYLGWYHYGTGGKPRWWVAGGWTDVGGFTDGTTTYNTTAMEFKNGQTIGSAFAAAAQNTAVSDKLTVTVVDANTIQLTWGERDPFTLERYAITAQSAGPGKVVFYGKDGDMHRVSAEASANPENISTKLDELPSGGEDFKINIAPDGSWMVFETERFDDACSGWACYAVTNREVTYGDAIRTSSGDIVHSEGFPAITNCGRKIVHPSADAGQNTLDLVVRTKSGDVWSDPVLLTSESKYAYNYNPAVSEDGTKLLFNCGDQPYGDDGTAVCEVNMDGTGYQVVASPDSPPAGYSAGEAMWFADYAPDGSIVFESDWSGTDLIWRMPAGGTPVPINSSYGNDGTPCVLPNGDIASYWLGRPEGSGDYELKIMPADGSSHEMAVTSNVENMGIGCGK